MIQIEPFSPLKVGMVTTGSEIYHGRIEDKFGPVLREKFSALGSEVIKIAPNPFVHPNARNS